VVQWRVDGWIYWRRVDLDLKKSNLKTFTNPANDTEEKAESMVEKKTGADVEP
jgi:hypothetical protein